jgi:hypothetical protein
LLAVRSLTGFIPPCVHIARSMLPRPKHPAPRFATIMIRPSVGQDVSVVEVIWVWREGNYFRKNRK